MESNAWCLRLTAAMIASGSAVHENGFGARLCSSTKRLMAACRSTTETNTPRFSLRLVSLAKKPSTALSQEMEGEPVVAAQPSANPRVLVGGVVVQDDVDGLVGRGLRLDGIEEADELLMPVALHVAAYDGAVEHVERGEQSRRAVPLVVMGQGATSALLHRQARLGAVERLDLALLVQRQHDGV